MKKGLLAVSFLSLSLAISVLSLSACGGSAPEDDSRITKLEADLKANTDALADLQQKVQQLASRVDALTPVQAPVTPSTPPPASPPPATSNATSGPKPLPQTSVSIDGLAVTPAQVNIGQVVTITVSVKNTGTVDGPTRVIVTEKKTAPTVSIDQIEYAETVTLTAGEARTITFTTSQTSAGTYTVQAGAKTVSYTVIDPNVPSS